MSSGLWNSVAVGLGAGAAGATVLSAMWGAGQLIRKRWNRTLGRRRSQAELLDQLACGSSLEFVEALLGIPQFLEKLDDREQRIYQLTGVWVLIEIHERAVLSFSITVTDPRMYYSTDRLTFGHLPIQLGRSTFENVPHHPNGARVWTGARRYGYLQHYYFGNPGSYQDYWISHNMCGAAATRPSSFWRSVDSGTYVTDGDNSLRDGQHDNVPPEVLSTIANTLTVLGPRRILGTNVKEQLMSRDVLGPDHDTVRLVMLRRR